MTHFLKDILSSVLSCFDKKKSFGMLSSGDHIYEIEYGAPLFFPYVKRHKIYSLGQGYNGEWRFKVEDGAVYIQESEMDKTIVDRKFSHFFLASSIKNVKKILHKCCEDSFLAKHMGIVNFNIYVEMKMALHGT